VYSLLRCAPEPLLQTRKPPKNRHYAVGPTLRYVVPLMLMVPLMLEVRLIIAPEISAQKEWRNYDG
jgi:hypothetical protein